MKNAKTIICDGIQIENGYCYRYDVYSNNLCDGFKFICSCRTLKQARESVNHFYAIGKTCLEIYKKRYQYTDYKEVEHNETF